MISSEFPNKAGELHLMQDSGVRDRPRLRRLGLRSRRVGTPYEVLRYGIEGRTSTLIAHLMNDIIIGCRCGVWMVPRRSGR